MTSSCGQIDRNNGMEKQPSVFSGYLARGDESRHQSHLSEVMPWWLVRPGEGGREQGLP